MPFFFFFLNFSFIKSLSSTTSSRINRTVYIKEIDVPPKGKTSNTLEINHTHYLSIPPRPHGNK